MTNTVVPGVISQLENSNDRFGRNTNIKGPTGYNDQLVMAAGTARDWTKPTGTSYVSITAEGGAQFWAKCNGTGVRPAVDATTGLAWDYMPGSYKTDGVTTIRVVSDVVTTIHFEAFGQ